MHRLLPVVLTAIALPSPFATPGGRAEKLAETWSEAITDVNDDHVRKPRAETEDVLAKELPKKARRAFADLLELDRDEEGLAGALEKAALAALDLDLEREFADARARLAEVDADAGARLCTARTAERFLLIGENGLTDEYLAKFADVFEAVLEGYDEVFGFEEYSKVPGKKLRVRLHLEEKITRPPHFAPQYPWHSEIDFPVIDAEEFRSPTNAGQFLFYGLCHELGHVVAMWGSRSLEEDHHAWAHYTGIVVSDHLTKKEHEALAHVRDRRWRSMDSLRKEVGEAVPSLDDRTGVLALLLALHDELGPEALGDAIDHVDREDRRLRINHVRYYRFEELKEGLLATLKGKKQKKRVEDLLRG